MRNLRMEHVFIALFSMTIFIDYKDELWGEMLVSLVFALVYTLILVWPEGEETKRTKATVSDVWGLFLWPEDGSSADIRKRVKALKRQVAEDKKIWMGK